MKRKITTIYAVIVTVILIFFIAKTLKQQQNINDFARVTMNSASDNLVGIKTSTNEDLRQKFKSLAAYNLTASHSYLLISSYHNTKLMLCITALVDCLQNPYYSNKILEKSEDISKYLHEVSINPSDDKAIQKLYDTLEAIEGRPLDEFN